MQTLFAATALLLFGTQTVAAIGGKFAPSGTGRYLVIGQDTTTIDDFVSTMKKVPAGVSGYTSLAQDGLLKMDDFGTGPQNMKHLVDTYPDVHLLVGLYVRDDLVAIANGQKDAEIKALLDTLSSFKRKIFLRFGYEVEGPWNKMDPPTFVRAWKRFYGVLQKHTIQTNVAMVWHLATNCAGSFGNHPISAWWPGSAFVDWVGISLFTPAGSPDQLNGCWGVVDSAVTFARNHGKPVAVCEAAPQGYHLSALTVRGVTDQTGATTKSTTAKNIWKNWFKSFFDYIEKHGDIIRSVTYINANWESQRFWNHEMGYHSGYWGDSRVQINSYIKKQWNKVVKSPTYIFASKGAAAASGGVARTPPKTSSVTPPRSSSGPPPPPPRDTQRGCPSSHPHRACRRCWASAAQASSSGC